MIKRESLQVGVAVAVVLAATLACRPRRVPSDAGVSVTAPTTLPATEATVTPSATAATTAKSTYKVGDKINVMWQGTSYPSSVVTVLPNDKYKIHYTGWAASYDETVGLDRIVGAKGAPTATAKPKATGGGGGGGGGVAADAPCPGPGITRRCGGVCVNIQEDDHNCGGCGTVCSGGKHCDGHLFCRDSEGNL
jgi:hypothetical protein